MSAEVINIDEFEFKLTCSSYPEEYEVFLDQAQVGYVRLSADVVRVACPDAAGVEMYQAAVRGDGCFATKSERDHHLYSAASEIRKFLQIRDLLDASELSIPKRAHFVIQVDDECVRYYEGYAAVLGREGVNGGLHVALITPDEDSMVDEFNKLSTTPLDKTAVRKVRIYEM